MFKECCPELIPVMEQVAAKEPHIDALIKRHKELNNKIDDTDAGREYMNEMELDALKKEKLKIKDEVYQAIMDYQKEKGE